MINAILALHQFQLMADDSRSSVNKNLLEHLIEDVKRGRLYAFGGSDHDATAIFVKPERTIYSYLLTQARPRQRPAYHVTMGRCPGSVTIDDWALLGSVAMSTPLNCADHEKTDIYAVPVLGPVRVSLFMTIRDSQCEPIFLIPNDLTPLQGLAALYRAVTDKEINIAQQLMNRRETHH